MATLSASIIHIRAIDSLRTVRHISLPRDFTGPVAFFQWSSSSRLILVASVDQIHVFSAVEDGFHATIRSPVPPAARPVFIGFGPSDTQVCVCASLGLRFAIFDLVSSRAVEIANPKSYTPPSACRGFCFRPGTRHLTILTRSSGKDTISIHHPVTKEVQRSWFPDTIDAQGLIWSSDGRWLVTWEAAAHGHKVLFYTSDGNLFKAWSGPQPLVAADADINLGPGAKVVEFSADARLLAIGDSSRRICILDMASVTESRRLQHPNCITPTDALQVWQEQVGSSGHHFVRALQTIFPPNGQTVGNIPPQSGCAIMVFDTSCALLATRLDDAPSTVWIWDTTTAELRAVLLFHGNISKISWHPTIRETLLIVCEGDSNNSLAFVWDPLSGGPKPLDFSGRLSNVKLQVHWLNLNGLEPGALFASDGRQYLLASLAVTEDETVPWLCDSESSTLLNDNSPRIMPAHTDDEYEEGASELDDTFCFKKA